MTTQLNFTKGTTLVAAILVTLSCNNNPLERAAISDYSGAGANFQESPAPKSVVGLWFDLKQAEDRSLEVTYSHLLDFRSDGQLFVTRYFDSFRDGARRFCKKECYGAYRFIDPNTIEAKYTKLDCSTPTSNDIIRVFNTSSSGEPTELGFSGPSFFSSTFTRYSEPPAYLLDAKTDGFNCDSFTKNDKPNNVRLPASK